MKNNPQRLTFFAMAMITLLGCGVSTTEQRIRQLKIELHSVQYELALRRDEIADMDKSAAKPTAVGVTAEWLQRHNSLKEQETQLLVKISKLEEQLNHAEADALR